MKKNRIFSLLTAGCLLTAALALPASAQESRFSDVTDPAQVKAVELLAGLDIISGTDTGLFQPGRALSRAEFCKMAVELTGKGAQVAAQLNRTIFKDVPSTHWARGYIHVAATAAGDAPAMIRGDATGQFHPDRPITAAEAITILSRVLGYTDTDVSTGTTWYSGYWALAQKEELLEGLSLSPEGELTRGQAAVLFENLLFAETKGSTALYLAGLGCTVKEGVLLLDGDVDLPNGNGKAIRVEGATYPTGLTGLPRDLEGTVVDLVLNKDEEVLALTPDENRTVRRLTLLSSQANHLTADNGEKVTVDREAKVWQNGEATSYDKVWAALKGGTSVLLCYTSSGELDYLYLTDAPSQDAQVQVLKRAGTGFTFPDSAPLFKNGVPATRADLRQYDVGVYGEGGSVQVSDRRITGVYENAAPNTTAPNTIRVMGCDFPVLECAISDLQSYKIGERMTLLLTHDNAVAGVVDPSVASGNAVGIAEVTKGSTKVTLIDGSLTFTGSNGLSENSAQYLDGKLVTVSASKKGVLSATLVKSSGTSSAIDLEKGTMGKTPLAPNVRFYDCVDGGAVVEVKRENFVDTTIPRNKILYTALDYAGRVSYVVLDDVTGDGYEYGYLYCETVENDHNLILERSGDTLRVDDISLSFKAQYGGVILNARGRLAARVELTQMKPQQRANFDVEDMTLTSGEGLWVVAEDVQCYNETTDEWYAPGAEGLAKALAFADTLTPYHDHTDHAKIRVVVVK